VIVNGRKMTARRMRIAASERLKFEHGIIVKPSDTFFTIAKIITDLRGGRNPKQVAKCCKDIIKKYALEYIESRKTVQMDQVQRDWYKSNFFLKSDEWYALRYKVLLKYGGKCQCCGNGKEQGAILQVDHIKPRSIYPELATDINNLQVLCRECNMGKRNKFATDWR